MSIIPKKNLVGYWPLDGHSLDMSPEVISVNQISVTDYDKSIYSSSTSSWATARNAATGTIRDGLYVQSTLNGATRFIERAFIAFDTSAIPDNAIILGAKIEIYGRPDSAAKTDSPSYRLYDFPSFGGIFGGSNYSQMGTVEQSDTYFDQLNTSGWNAFVLNPAGVGSITKTGYVAFGIREAVYDLGNTQPTGSNVIQFHDYTTSTTLAPRLTVTYLRRNNGVVTGASTLASKNPTIPTSLAYNFNGTSNYITLVNDCSTILNTQQFAINVWAKCNTKTGTQPIITLGLTNYRKIYYSIGTLYIDTPSVSGSIANKCDNKWHMITMTSDGVNIRGHIDGGKFVGAAYSTTLTCTDPIHVGRVDTSYYTGQIQEVSIFNKALSSSEIQAIYNQSKHKYSTQATVLGAILQLASSITDTFNLTEVTSRLLAMNTSTTDTITPTDVSTAFRAFTATVIETITSSDVYTSTQSFLSTITDTITNSDTFTSIRGFVSTVTDTITSSETTNAGMALFSTIVDTITTVEELASNIFKSVKPRVLEAVRSIPKLIGIDNNKPRGL